MPLWLTTVTNQAAEEEEEERGRRRRGDAEATQRRRSQGKMPLRSLLPRLLELSGERVLQKDDEIMCQARSMSNVGFPVDERGYRPSKARRRERK